MKSTQTWVWVKTPKIYGEWHPKPGNKWLFARNLENLPLKGWMADYRKKIQSIDTDKKAQAAIYDYWLSVIAEWNGHIQAMNKTI